MADALASQCVEATMPNVPISSGRVVNDMRCSFAIAGDWQLNQSP
jgi:hypothetical protein